MWNADCGMCFGVLDLGFWIFWICNDVLPRFSDQEIKEAGFFV
jgi:hypothetical protein